MRADAFYLLVICAMCVRAHTVSVTSAGPFSVNDPVPVTWNTTYPATGAEAIGLYYVPCIQVDTLENCINGVDILPADEVYGTHQFEGMTPISGDYKVCIFNQSSFTELATSAAFSVVSVNTVEIITPEASRQFGVVIKWTAPARHSTDDICLEVVGCNYTDPERNCYDCRSAATEGVLSGFEYFPNPNLDGTALRFIYRMHAEPFYVTSANTSVFSFIAPLGKCSDDGTACTLNENCTSGQCDFAPAPELTSDNSTEIVALVGEVVRATFFVAAESSVGVHFYYSNTISGAKITVDPSNSTVLHFEWDTSSAEPRTYDLAVWAADARGRRSGDLSLSVTVREQYCSVWGDPHYVTFDDVQYDFQGYGEFTALKAKPETKQGKLDIHVQVRTMPCLGSGDITCVAGFAADLGLGSVSYAQNISNSEQWVFYIDGKATVITEISQNITFGDSILGTASLKDGGFEANFMSNLGISFRLWPGAFAFHILVSKNFISLTSGLCGTWNGILDDEFTLPNGTIPLNSSETVTWGEVYNQFGLQWRVSEGESFFNYTAEQTNWSTVNPVTFAPLFEPNWQKSPVSEPEARRLCEGIPGIDARQADSCVFDVAVGGPEMAIRAAETRRSQCLQEEPEEACAPLTQCTNFCGLNGECKESNGAWSCACYAGFEPDADTCVKSAQKSGSGSDGSGSKAQSKAAQSSEKEAQKSASKEQSSEKASETEKHSSKAKSSDKKEDSTDDTPSSAKHGSVGAPSSAKGSTAPSGHKSAVEPPSSDSEEPAKSSAPDESSGPDTTSAATVAFPLF